MAEVSANLFDALERISKARTDDELLAAANNLAALRREPIANDVAGKEAKYPSGLPKKYQPVADEWRRLGWEVQDFGCFDYGDQLKLVIARNDERKLALLHAECEEVVFDVLDTPWWASVRKRKDQEFQAAVNERVMSEWKDGVAATESAPDELMQIAKEQNVVAEEVERLFGAIRNLVVENHDLRRRMELLDKYAADTLRLTANTMRKNPARDKALSGIALQVQQWLDWQERERGEEGMPCNDDTHMMRVPVWPTRGQLKAWIEVLKTPEPRP